MRFFSDGTVPAKLAPSIGYLVPVIIFFPERRAFGIYFLCIAMNRTDDVHPKRITVGENNMTNFRNSWPILKLYLQ